MQFDAGAVSKAAAASRQSTQGVGMQRSWFTLAAFCFTLACSKPQSADSNASATLAVSQPGPVSIMESKAKALFDTRQKSAQESQRLLASAKKVLASYLFDPFSAQYRRVRSGRGGAVCGQYNAKNRMGAYTGFKDFVIPRGESLAYLSSAEGGFLAEPYSDFTRAYVASCATSDEVKLYKFATTPIPQPSDEPDEAPSLNTI
jgi:hypothetical protein